MVLGAFGWRYRLLFFSFQVLKEIRHLLPAFPQSQSPELSYSSSILMVSGGRRATHAGCTYVRIRYISS